MKNLNFKWSGFLMLMVMFWLLGGLYLMFNEKIIFLDIKLFNYSSDGVYFTMMYDWMSFLFLAAIFYISASVFTFSNMYMNEEIYEKRFIYLVVMFIFSMMMMVLGTNMFSILLGWDGLGLVSYCLVIYYQNKMSFRAGMITILSNRVGDFGLLMSIIFLLKEDWNILLINKMEWIGMMFILLAACTSSAQFPFMAWLPAAMSAPTPVSALVHSSTLVTAGVYLLIRFNMMFMDKYIEKLLMYLSLLTIILSGMCAFYEHDMKKIVAMSTLSQLGFMMFSLSIGFWEVAYFHMLTHALFKSMLFLSVGEVLHCYGGVQDMRFMGGINGMNMASGLGVMISSMCLFGLPFVAGFYSKEMIIQKMMNGSINMILLLLFIFGLLLTILYSIRMIKLSMLYTFIGFKYMGMSESNEGTMSILFLGFCSVCLGSGLQWGLFVGSEITFLSSKLNLMIFMMIIMMMFIVVLIMMKCSQMIKISNMGGFSMLYSEFLMNYLLQNYLIYEASATNDHMWGEMFGVMGTSSMLMKNKGLVFIQKLDFKFMFMIFIMSIIISY